MIFDAAFIDQAAERIVLPLFRAAQELPLEKRGEFHGGRIETGRGTIDILPEVVDAVGGRIPVLVDGGFRRGSDVYKAPPLGARAIGIGRPYIYGLASFGQEGVERVLDILRAERSLMMRQCGTPAIAQITRASALRNGLRL